MHQITKEDLAAAKGAQSHPLMEIFLSTINHFGMTQEALAYLLSIVKDGGVDMTDPADLAALDAWCLHTYDMSTSEQERVRTQLYLGLVALGYPPKWHNARIDELQKCDRPAYLFRLAEEAA